MSDLFDLPFEDDRDPLDEPAPVEREAPAGDTAALTRPRDVRQVFSVTELTLRVRDLLEHELPAVWVEGELSNCRTWNDHLYFTLKDQSSQLRGFMFRSTLRYLKFKPSDGQRVIARGRVSVYEPKGEYQLVCEHLEPHGLGALQLAFEQVKQRLKAEGLFEGARKRPLPALPRRIGVVTSLDGAALRDIVHVLGRRHRTVQMVIRHVRVQGDGAALEIARGIRAIGRVPDVDVVIVGRGGGSAEDLWSFNEEVVARAIAQSPVPIISAIGHETDVTIADFVADLRAPTPSAAAELVVAAKDEFCSRIDRLQGRLDAVARGRIRDLSRRVHVLTGRPAFVGVPNRVAMRARRASELLHTLDAAMRGQLGKRLRRVEQLRRQLESRDLGRQLAAIRTRLVAGEGRLTGAIATRRHRAQAALQESATRLEALSPLAVLGRGYAVCWDAGRSRVIRDAATTAPGDRVRVTLGRGELDCEVRDRKT